MLSISKKNEMHPRASEGSEQRIKDIIYIWVTGTEGKSFNAKKDYCPIFNDEKYPFLQSAVGHAAAFNIHIVQYNPHKGTEYGNKIDYSFEKLANDFKTNNLNIKIYDFIDLVKEDLEYAKLASQPYIKFSQVIDMVKIFIGASLYRLGLDEAFIADFDCVIPSNIQVNSRNFSVLPLIDPTIDKMKVSDQGTMDHYIENGLSYVRGEKNPIFQQMLIKVKSKNAEYYCTHQNDAIYRIYVAEILRSISFSLSDNEPPKDEELFEKYASRTPEITSELFQLENKIKYDRGGSWAPTNKNIGRKVPILKAGVFPVYAREIEELHRWVLFDQSNSTLVSLMEPMIRKNYNCNSIIERNNSLQKKSSILPEYIDRFDDSGDATNDILNNIKCFIKWGSIIDDDVLMCLLVKDENKLVLKVFDLLVENTDMQPMDLKNQLDDLMNKKIVWQFPISKNKKSECIDLVNQWYSDYLGSNKKKYFDRGPTFFPQPIIKQDSKVPRMENLSTQSKFS